MSNKSIATIATMGIDIGRNSFHVVKGQKNDFRDAEAIAEAVQRPTMKFVATKTADQLDLQALHRVRERLVRQRTGITNQIRAFPLERGVAVRQGFHCLRRELPGILARRSDVLSPRMIHLIEDLAGDWHRLTSASNACPTILQTWLPKTRPAGI
jgi:transposase